MGIPSYFSYIVRNHRSILIEYKKKKMTINNLYMDCNSIIYDIVNELEKNKTNILNIEEEIINMVCNKIKYYIKLIKPTSNIYIAFDGVAPVAKMSQQKNRRYKTNYEEKILSSMGVNKNKIFNTICITPGTAFMNKLNVKIKETFNNSEKYNVKKIIISASDQYGEGEHKIYEYIRNNKNEHTDTTTVIYGLDADLIMLTLNHLHIAPGMYLFRETPYFIKSIDNTLNPNDNYLLNIPEFASVLARDLNDSKPDPNNSRIFDYIFLCFLLGNDFLPHFPSLNIRTTGIDRIMDAYKNVLGNSNNNIIKNDKINWNMLRKIILLLSKTEENMLIEEYQIRAKQSKSITHRKLEIEDKLQSIPMLDRSIELYINPYENGWRERYYQELFNIKIDDNRCKELCINYLEGLEWTYKYYKDNCNDWKWRYKYNYPPLLSDLVRYIPSFDTDFINKQNKPVHSLTQLIYVLPENSLYLIPDNLKQKVLEKYNTHYNTELIIEWSFCRYLWEAHIKVKEMNIDSIERLVANYIKNKTI
tara:strand:+ start:59 stop:1654 length:1596 start_codon:yes stop_codon:yes gene_type:complete